MSIQDISIQYNNTLTQYKNIYSQYISLLNSSNNNLITINNSSYTSPSTFNTIKNTTLQKCLSSCSSNKSCSGATFNSSNNTCSLSSGKGNIINASGYTAIVPQLLYYNNQLQQLNNQLISLNTQMQNIAISNKTEYQQTSTQNQEQNQILLQNYQTLMEQKDQLDLLVKENETAESAYNNSSLIVNSNYSSYIALLIISILLVFLLIKFSLIEKQVGGGVNYIKREAMFLFGIMVVFLGLSNVYKNDYIYLFVSILLVSYILAKIKIQQLN